MVGPHDLDGVVPLRAGPVPGDVRKAIDYMRRNLGRRFSTGDLAAACGVAERTLRKHFAAFVGVSPLEYLHRLRLTAARAELTNRASTASVTEVATRYGFSHFGRFSSHYRRRFGEPPSRTLARRRAAEPDRARRPQGVDAESTVHAPLSREKPYELVLQAMPLCRALDRASCNTAIRLLLEAVRRDPDYGLAQALLSWCHGQQAVYNWTGAPDAHRQRALAIARDAALLDRNDALVLTMLASAECVAGDLSAAQLHIRRALAIDPSSAWAWTRSGYVHCDLGKPDRALADFERALRLSPLDPMRHNAVIGTGFAHLLAGQYEQAVAHLEQGLIESPGSIWANRELAAAAAMAGDRDKAARCVAIVEGYAPSIRVSSILDAIPIRHDRLRAGFGAALARAGFSA
jgi:AraC-like DNA-binding protein/Flp pilus assembly protein TadD